jgi:hypothetical protein
VDVRLEHEAFGVDQDVALTPLDLLGPIVTPVLPAYPGALHRLGIHHARAGLRISLQAHTQAFSESSVDTLPGTIDTPSPEIVVDGWPSRKVVGKQAPLATALQDVEDGVQDRTKVVGPWASISFGSGHVRFDVFPFGVREICWVRFSHAC